MSIHELLIKDFSGGQRQDQIRSNPNESALVSNLDHVAGSLAAMPPAYPVALADSLGDSGFDKQLYSIEPYADPFGLTWFIGRRGRNVWLSKPFTNFDRATIGGVTEWRWTMEEPAGTIPTDHIQGIQFTSDTTMSEKLWSSYVRKFDGMNASLGYHTSGTSPFGITSSNQFSVSMWVRCDSINHSTCLLAGAFLAAGYWQIFLTSSNKMCVEVHNSSQQDVISYSVYNVPTDGSWNLLSFTYNNTTVPTLILYVNGVHDTTVTGTAGALTVSGAGDFYIGGYGPIYWFNGAIGTVSIYSTALSQLYFQAQYANEISRYVQPAPGNVQYRWMPLVVDTVDNGSVTLCSRQYPGPERVEQIGKFIYMSPKTPGESDYILRWDGMLVDKSSWIKKTSNASGLDYYQQADALVGVTENMYQFSSAGVRPGDILILEEAGSWKLVGHRIEMVCTDGSGTYANYGVFTDEDSTPSNTTYPGVIVRVNRAGLPQPPICTGTATGTNSSANLTKGIKYQYCYRYINSITGYASDASLAADVTYNGVDGFFTVSVKGWEASPDWDVDGVEIYRSKYNASTSTAGPFYLMATLSYIVKNTSSLLGGSYTAMYRAQPASWVDDGSYDPDSSNIYRNPNGVDEVVSPQVLLLATGFERPDPIANLIQYNGRLAGSGIEAEANEYFSSEINYPEYWAGVDFETVGTTPPNNNAGLQAIVGSSLEPIRGIIPEVGTFITTGVVGSDLLIFLPTRCVRLSGNTLTDFAFNEGFSEGLANVDTLVRCGSSIMWFDGEHIRKLAIGASDSQIVSYPLWPRGFSWELYSKGRNPMTEDKVTVSSSWAAAYKDGWYYLACRVSGFTANDRIYAYHLETGTWKQIAEGARYLLLADVIRVNNNPRLLGASSAADSNGLYDIIDVDGVWQWTAAQNAQPFAWISSPLFPTKDPEHIRDLKSLTRITACFTAPQNWSQNVTLSVFANGDLNTAMDTSNAVRTGSGVCSVGSPYSLTVADPTVTANTQITYSGGTGTKSTFSLTPGVGFVIHSTVSADPVNWSLIEQNVFVATSEAGNGAGSRQIVEWWPTKANGFILQLGISGILTDAITLEWVQVTIETR